ncbi:hypothetical protein BgiBS90_024804 [Biomphalaria glabrata]|nr:hypothetical protein BgiBS90_024804 [Biomphalaria glabrata]
MSSSYSNTKYFTQHNPNKRNSQREKTTTTPSSSSFVKNQPVQFRSIKLDDAKKEFKGTSTSLKHRSQTCRRAHLAGTEP